MRALRELPAPADEVAKDLTDAFFRDMDASLSEMGVGDTVVPKRMKKVAEAFYGRAHAYDRPSTARTRPNSPSPSAATPMAARHRLRPWRVMPWQPIGRFRTADLDTLLATGPTFPDPETLQGGNR